MKYEDIDGKVFGAGRMTWHDQGGWVEEVWEGEFQWDRPSGKWKFIFVGEGDQLSDIEGVGDTPQEAFESLVTRWTILNGGVESPTLRYILPALRADLAGVRP